MRLVAILALVSATFPAFSQPIRLPQPGRLPVTDFERAWSMLPRDSPPLPLWARTLVGPLPKTTAKMIELDTFHRSKNPLGPELSGILRWTVADALGSTFGKATAEADLRRAGVPDRAITNLASTEGLDSDVRLAAAFARKLTREGFAITDAEFAALLKIYGPERMTAIVHSVAYANFHNRIVLGLGATGDPVPPVDATFSAERLAKIATPARPSWDDLKLVTTGGLSVRVEWSNAGSEELNASLEAQKERTLRIPLPPSKDVTPKESGQASRVLWTKVSTLYQPEMPRVWFAAMNTFYEEAKVDRVFTNSVFWVVTRTNDCFY